MTSIPSKAPPWALRWWSVAVAAVGTAGVSLPLGTLHAASARLTSTGSLHWTERNSIAVLNPKSVPFPESGSALLTELSNPLDKAGVNDWYVLQAGERCFDRP